MVAKIKNSHILHVIKEFICPSNVTWKSRKDSVKETILVLCVVLVVAAFMIAADSLIGFLFGLAM